MVNVFDAVGEWTIHSGPLYQRLATAIRNAVLRGDLAPGTILPAERHMARALAVGRSTVVAAYDMLRSDGVLTSKQGSGTWVGGAERNASSRAGQQESLGRAALSGGEQLIDLATASLPAAPAVRDAIAALGSGLADHLLDQAGYSALGLLELRRAVADMFSEEGLHTSPEQILITTGDQQALSLLTQHLLDTGDSVLVEDPTSPGLLDLVRREPVAVRSARSLSSSGEQALLGVIAKTDPSVVYIIASFGPEGLVSNEDSLRRFAAGVRGFSGTVIDDTSSRHLLRDDAPPYLASLTSDTTVYTVGSMSKLFWGGLRIGWIRGDENAILRLSRAKARADLGTSLLSQLLSAWLLRRLPEVKAQRYREIDLRIADAVDVVRRELPDFELSEPAGAVSLWLRMPRGASRPFAETARRNGVAIVPGDSLSADGASDPFVRLALGADASAFADGVSRLGRAWTEYDRGAASGSVSPLTPPLV